MAIYLSVAVAFELAAFMNCEVSRSFRRYVAYLSITPMHYWAIT